MTSEEFDPQKDMMAIVMELPDVDPPVGAIGEAVEELMKTKFPDVRVEFGILELERHAGAQP